MAPSSLNNHVVARVLWRDAQGKEGSVELSNQEIHIGRAMDCAIRTDDAMVSRHHARIFWGGGQYYIEDLGSANGLFYQEQRVPRHAFKHGDAVRCGSLWLRFVDMQAGYGQQPSGPMPQQPMMPPQPMQPPMRQPDPIPQPQGLPSSGPYASYRQPTPQGMMPISSSPPSAPVLMPDAGKKAEADAEEMKRLNRRIEQLQTELRLYRGGKGAEVAQRVEELENENSKLEKDISLLKSRIKELESTLETQGGDVRVQRADKLAVKTTETVQALNDILSNLRINVMAAEGEFEQFAHTIPRASFELIREALRSSSGDVDTARELLRKLRELAD